MVAAYAALSFLLAPATTIASTAQPNMLARLDLHVRHVQAMGRQGTGDLRHFQCQDRQVDTTFACRTPQQMQTAYGFDSLLSAGYDGSGRTIIVVDEYDNPYITSDLNLFDEAFDLPDPELHIYRPFGQTPFDFNDSRADLWAGEISLDVEWAHAMAPGAAIALVLAPDANLFDAIEWAIKHNIGDVLTQSFGLAESCAAQYVHRIHPVYLAAAHAGITAFAASGDSGVDEPTCDGAGLLKDANWPSSDPLVTAVGGTTLFVDPSTGSYQSERAWSDRFSGCYPPSDSGCSGGGFSSLFRRPDYQGHTSGIPKDQRGEPDVAYNAGLDGGVVFHFGVADVLDGADPADPTSFWVAGGTSAGSPQWAALGAIADQMANRRLGQLNDALYRIAQSPAEYAAAFHDVTAGNNNYVDLGYQAGAGWDPVTGLGTPNAADLVPLLAQNH